MIALISKEDMVPFLQAVSRKMEVVAPVMDQGTPAYVTWKGQPLALEGENPLVSPVKLLYPQREVLFRYIQECGSYTFEEPEQKARLILGVRPCDMQALKVLDSLLYPEPTDQAYQNRRRSAVIAAVSCVDPGVGCFCAQIGSGPECKEGCDLLFTDLGPRYLVETFSPAGVLMLKEHPEFFTPATRSHLQEKERLLKEAREKIVQARPWISREGMAEAIKNADWKSLGERCLSCGGCSFICPVCHCFSIYDQGVPDGERVRCADSCILSGFSRMTSGANPRPDPGQRLCNWYLDKFEYTPQKTGHLGCVGCGRCNRVCLSAIDRWSQEVLK
ncbi:MAG: hypothetical protein GKC10_07110 [Methanosarcinales archaeon]|nr:hypothetical protein [Methanosarcinales archaeon]